LDFQKIFSRCFYLRFILDLVTGKHYSIPKILRTKKYFLGEVRVKLENKIICRGKELNVGVEEIIFENPL
jgi:hypothetical protein